MGDARDCLTRGLEAFGAKDYEAAVGELEQATIENRDSFQAFLYLGAAYAEVGRHNAAIGAFKRAGELRPNDARVHYNLGQAYEAAGVPKEAVYEYSRAVRIDPSYDRARTAYSALRSRLSAAGSGRIQVGA